MKNDYGSNLLFLTQNIECKIKNHQGFNLSRACFNKDCKLSRLMCDKCEENHDDHKLQTFSFYKIQDYMNEKLQLDVDMIVNQLNELLQILKDQQNQQYTIF